MSGKQSKKPGSRARGKHAGKQAKKPARAPGSPGKSPAKKPAYTDGQKRIASALVAAPKTAGQLAKELSLPDEEIMKELAGLKKLGMMGAAPEGAYALKPEIAGAVAKRREIASDDQFRLKLRAIIEAQSVSKEILEKELKRMETALRKEPDFTIYDCVLERMVEVEGEGGYASFLEITLSVRDFRALMRLMVFYGPASVEVLKPPKYEISADAMQDGLMDLAEMVHAYNAYIMKMMNRAELDEFQKKIFDGK